MNKQIALAYGITGLAVAAAFIAIVGSATDLFSDKATVPPSEQAPTLAAESSTRPVEQLPTIADPVSPEPELRVPAAAPEIVYVDAPARARQDDAEEHEREWTKSDREGRHREHDDD